MGLFSKETPLDMQLVKESMFKRVAYVGLERCDLIVALVNVAVKAGLKVAVADNSVTHDLFGIYYNEEDDDDDIIDRGNLCIIKNAVLDESNHGFDLVVMYLGANEPIEVESDIMFLMTDAQRANIRAVREYLLTPYMKRMVVYRDQSSDFSVTDMAHFLGFDKSYQMSTVKYDRKEAEAYAKLTRQPRAKFTLAMASSSSLFFEMCRMVFGEKLTDKQVTGLIRKGVSFEL